MKGPPSGMANASSEEKRQQVEALGRLGWSLRRIEREADVRRETATAYLRAAGTAVRGHGGTKPKPATFEGVITHPHRSKPATSLEVITDLKTTASSYEPYREIIERWLDDGRTGMAI